MPKIKQQTAGKIGLFSAIMIIFGSLVGIGIFFKNYSVFENNGGNPIGILLSWIITIILVMCLALSFCEISSCKIKNRADGFGGWTEKFCGYNFGRYSKLSYNLVFYTINAFAVMFFTGEACMNCFANLGVGTAGAFDFGRLTTLYVFLAGGGLFALFIVLNMLASKGMTKFSNITGIIKFVPIIAVIVLGITFGIIGSQHGGLWNGNWYPGRTISDKLDVTGIIASVPCILFAFEGYLVVGNIAGEMENPEKTLPLSVILGLVIISALYLAITIGCMTAGTGNVYELMTICFGDGSQLAMIFTIVMSAFIFICVIGVLNAIAFSGMRAFQACCEQGILFKGKNLVNKKPNNKLFAGGVWFAIIVGIWWAGTLIPSTILNTDQIVDGSTSIMIICTYILYVVVLTKGFINRFTQKVEVRKLGIFPATSIIGILGALFIIIFCSLIQFLAQPIVEGEKYVVAWGLFVNNKANTNFSLNWWQSIVTFWSMFLVMISAPFINDFFVKWFDKSNKQPLIWQKSKQNIRFK